MNRVDRQWRPPRLPTVPKATKVDGAHPVPLARPGDKLQGEFLGVKVTTPGELPDVFLQRIDGLIVSTRAKPDVLDALVGVPVGTWALGSPSSAADGLARPRGRGRGQRDVSPSAARKSTNPGYRHEGETGASTWT